MILQVTPALGRDEGSGAEQVHGRVRQEEEDRKGRRRCRVRGRDEKRTED